MIQQSGWVGHVEINKIKDDFQLYVEGVGTNSQACPLTFLNETDLIVICFLNFKLEGEHLII